MGKAKDTCILNKRCLLRNQLTPARKRDTRKRAPSELLSERFLQPSFAFSFKLPSQERYENQLAPSELVQALCSQQFPLNY